jgi:alanine dehydrogenase
LNKGEGQTAHFDDLMYAEDGVKLPPQKRGLQLRYIVKVAPPNNDEISLIKERQVLISSFQPSTQSKEYIEKLLNLKITAVGYEFMKDRRDDVFPIIQSLSEISGTTSILIAAEYLSNAHNGKGEMLGGISGISPTDIVILGAGTAGEFAARTALGLGASVKVFDISMHHLRDLQERLGTRIFTSVLQPRVLAKAMRSAVCGNWAIPPEKEQQPFIVSEDAVKQMKPGSVIVDLRIDHGGCFETSEITSFQNPVYTKHGVIHYCVPNIPRGFRAPHRTH